MSAVKRSANRSLKLLIAVEQENLHKIKEHLDGGFHVDCQDDEGRTCLQIASANGYLDGAQLLLAKGAGLEIQNSSGWTAMMLACYYGHAEVVKLLIKNGAEVNTVNTVGVTPLVCACRSGHLKVVSLLVDSGAEINIKFIKDSICSVTPLMTAAQHGHRQVIEFLINHNADVDRQDPTTGWTALMLASLNGHVDVVKLLVEEQNADTNMMNVNEETALSIAASRHRDIVEAYLEEKTKIRPSRKGSKVKRPMVIDAARNGDTAKMKELINLADVDVNFQDDDGATPLIYACMHGHTEIVELLLSKNASLNIQDNVTGWTALMQATYYSHIKAMKLLLQVNADTSLRDLEGLTVFDIATIIANPEINRLLARCTLRNSSLENGKNNKMSRWISDEDILDSEEKTSTKHWWSKMSEKLPKFGTMRGPVTFGRVPVNPPDTIGAPSSGDHSGEAESVDDHSLRPSSSIISVLDSARAKKEKPKISLVSPQSKLPDDVIAPVLPPFSKRSTFELPKIPKDAKLSHNNINEEVTPQLPAMPSFQLNGVNLQSEIVSLHYEDYADSYSSVDSYSSRQPTSRPTSKANFTTVSTAQESQYSPQSSMTSTSSMFTSVSRQHGKAAMPSAPLQNTPKKRFDQQHYPASPAHSTSSWQHKSSSKSPNPSPMSNRPTPMYPSDPTSRSNRSSQSSVASRSQLPSITNGSKGRNNKQGMSAVLDQLSLARYNAVFEEEEVDIDTFLTMNDRDLREMGIQHTSHRNQLLDTIKQINSKQ